MAAIRQMQAGARACFNAGLERDPTLAGQPRVTFVIGEDGHVKSASVAGLSDPGTTKCIERVIKGTFFPRDGDAGAGDVTVTWPGQ
jgi:hypothetical protein